MPRFTRVAVRENKEGVYRLYVVPEMVFIATAVTLLRLVLLLQRAGLAPNHGVPGKQPNRDTETRADATAVGADADFNRYYDRADRLGAKLEQLTSQ